MSKSDKDLDVGGLLLGLETDSGDMEEGGEEDDADEVDPVEMKREAMSAFRDALKGDDLDAQVSAFETLMEACGLSGAYAGEDE